MSEPSQFVPMDASDELEEEVLLEPQQWETLRVGLRGLPVSKPKAELNARVLTMLASGRDFNPWWQQTVLRLRWMLLPAVLGFGFVLAFAAWQVRRLPPLPPPYPRINRAFPAPPLPPLPRQIRRVP